MSQSKTLRQTMSVWIFVITAFFLLSRLILLFTAGAHIFEAEELYRGTIASEMIHGLKMSLWDYQADHYSGGSLVLGAAIVPFFLVLGPTLFALKLAPIMFAAGAVFLALKLLVRYFGGKAAVTAGLFFIFAPPSFAQLSLVAMGFHSESVFFTALMLTVFLNLRHPKSQSTSPVWFGFIGGLSFWFTHITVITFLSCLAAWALQDRKSLFNKSSLGLLALGTGAGLIPWAVYNLTHGLEGIGFFAKAILRLYPTEGDATRAFALDPLRLIKLAGEAIPASFGFPNFFSLNGFAVSTLYYLAGLSLCVPLYFRFHPKKWAALKQSPLLPFLLYPIIYTAIYWLSSVELTAVKSSDSFTLFFDDCRYFIPFHFVFIMLCAIGSTEKAWGKVAAVCLLILGITGFRNTAFREPAGQTLHYQGHSYLQLGALRGHLWPKYFRTFSEFLTHLNVYPDPSRYFVRWSALYGLQFEHDIENPENIKRWKNLVPKDYQIQFAEALGFAVGSQRGLNPDLQKTASHLSPELRSYFYAGFVSSHLYLQFDHILKYFEAASKLPENEREGFYFMLGQFCPFGLGSQGPELILKRARGETDRDLSAFFKGTGVRCMLNWLVDGFTFAKAVQDLEFKIPQNYRKDFYWGIGWGTRQQTAEDRRRGLDRLKEIPAEGYADALEGFTACERAYKIPETTIHYHDKK